METLVEEQRPRVGRPPRLERRQVVDAALALVDEIGWDRLSMRRVAARLSVDVSVLYTYVRDKRDLEAAVFDELVERSPSVDGLAPREAVLSEFVGINRLARQHLALFTSVVAHGMAHEPSIKRLHQIRAHLVELGVPARQSAAAYELLYAHAIGMVVPQLFRALDEQATEHAFAKGLGALLDMILDVHRGPSR